MVEQDNPATRLQTRAVGDGYSRSHDSSVCFIGEVSGTSSVAGLRSNREPSQSPFYPLRKTACAPAAWPAR